MNKLTDKRHASERFPSGVKTNQSVTVSSDSDAALSEAETAQDEQQALLENSSVEALYSAALAIYVDAKHEQAERIEDRLEGLLDQQENRLHQLESKQPGLLSLPSTKAQWQSQVQQQQALVQKLHGRLDGVREVKDGMGLHGPRIEDLATRKLRQSEPELAENWDQLRAAQRAHETLMRKIEQEKRLKQRREQGLDDPLRRGHTQSLSLNRSH
ncbi:IncP plasmid survival protein KfrC family protein [Pseudomonas syringae]|uniref:IncP plasmid survival protein KfrC family protein n=1 Tax=Pseudomonas syringae TaxID=317 RepID=UPI000209916D|nr:IncP plasmid survival protein KfrC family protein [Pseudomonas syringae]MDP5168565.1 conjugal transfer protein [Pseudomonas syringae pv. aptata str. DSM 50252]